MAWPKACIRALLVLALWRGVTPAGPAQAQAPPPAPVRVELQPAERDAEIRDRLQRVMEATGWFLQPVVRVQEGVVFLEGRATSDTNRVWAGNLARGTQGVTAVVNHLDVAKTSAWDFTAARSGLASFWSDAVHALPLVIFGLLILGLSALAAMLAARRTRALLRKRVQAKLLRGVLAWGTGALVFLTGTYIVLRVSGLTQLALTLVGGTGLVGLALGIAFREITENFLASIFLSVQHPFANGDLIEVAGATGYVQQLNIRTTVLMTLDGNLLQVPNSTVYKSTLCNFTANPNRRETFTVGIGYDDSIDEAQEIARKVLADHPAVLKDPEPWVLADGLGSATVNLKVYFWLDGHANSWLKVRSSVIRLVKRAFQEHNISMPDAAREVLFPKGVSVTLLKETTDPVSAAAPATPDPGSQPVATRAEAGLSSEAGTIEAQARRGKLDEGENLLKETNPKS